MPRLWCPVVAVLVAAASAQYDYVSECPAENGFFADALQCDRYYECQDGEVGTYKVTAMIMMFFFTQHLWYA